MINHIKNIKGSDLSYQIRRENFGGKFINIKSNPQICLIPTLGPFVWHQETQERTFLTPDILTLTLGVIFKASTRR